MPIVNRVADLHAEITAWRRDIHANPELLYDVHRTAASVADKLKTFGCDEVVAGIGRTGVVGVIRGRKAGDKVVGLRADMDALPIVEEADIDFRSEVDGHMHACGHDCNTAMLLGAARMLKAREPEIHGTVKLLFQPAEEGGAGGLRMCEEGVLTAPTVQRAFGLHVWPYLPTGHVGSRAGAFLASAGVFDITVVGTADTRRCRT